jgi:signal transduction histidine kinase
MASHELRTPLTPVMLQLQALLRQRGRAGAGALSAESLLVKIELVHRHLERLTRMIDDLLDISRITVGRLRIEAEEVDLRALVEEVIGRSSDALRRAGSGVDLRAPAPLPGRWDRLRLDQIVTNLLSNAIKYGDGRPIEIALEGDERTARLVVRDHGIGIAPADQARIFQRFERAVSERHYGGFGLGLWITRQVVEAMGGSIQVVSRLGEGATFTVELPRSGA